LIASHVAPTWAHGGLVGPQPWWNQFGATPIKGGSQIMSLAWFMNWTYIPENVLPKLNVSSSEEDLSTSKRGVGIVSGTRDWYGTTRHPWLAPGTAPVDSPCGILGGNKRGCFQLGSDYASLSNTKSTCGGGGTDDAEDSMTEKSFADYFKSPTTTYWRAGQTAETSWGVIANHAGGYSYRLCSVESFDTADLLKVTEACFEANGLDFEGKQWVQYSDDVAGRTEVQPILVTGSDVSPANSQWRKNPIPSCKREGSDGCDEEWFDPPVANMSWADYLIIDKVRVPSLPGKYVLGWRYDCERTAQIWLGCSNVQILGPNEQEPPAPTPCICPGSLVLDGTAVAQYFGATADFIGWPWPCSEADRWAKDDKQNSCAIYQQYVQPFRYQRCCVPLPPVPEPEPGAELGGGTGEAETEHLLAQLGTKFSHRVQIQAHRDPHEVELSLVEQEKVLSIVEAGWKKVIDAHTVAMVSLDSPTASMPLSSAWVDANGEVVPQP